MVSFVELGVLVNQGCVELLAAIHPNQTTLVVGTRYRSNVFGETGSILGECWSDDIGYKLCSPLLPPGRLVGDLQLEEGVAFEVRDEIPIKLIKDPVNEAIAGVLPFAACSRWKWMAPAKYSGMVP